MTGFTSGTQARDGRTVNHDPKPWAYSRTSPDRDDGPFGHNDRSAERIDAAMLWFPRPEFAVLDNPILAEYRKAQIQTGGWALRQFTLGGTDDAATVQIVRDVYADATPEQRDHAGRVLAKLAALS